MDKHLCNILRNVVTQCRKQLEEAIREMLQGRFGIHPDGTVEDLFRLPNLSAEDQQYRDRVVVHLRHIESSGAKPKDAAEQLVREAAFTHLNRLCAYKLMAKRGLIDDPVGKVLKSRGFIFYLADHPEDEKLFSGGEQTAAYRHYLDWLNRMLSEEIGVLFSPDDLASGLFPPHRVIESVLGLLNSEELQSIWTEDETIGWVYQYFTPKELRDKARKESSAPRNSYELAFRNQFFTPRYVVEFLTDNTLGRTWYEMRKGETSLVERCRYFVRRPNEIFLQPGEDAAGYSTGSGSDRVDDANLSKEELLRQPVYIPHREKKDPREIRALDPACGSGHFLLYCFDLLLAIYEEAYADEDLGPQLRADFPDAEDFRRRIPALILEHNLHGIDIDLRATQIAGLALWLRAQRAWQEMGVRREDRPRIRRSHVVCAEPMPGEQELLDEFTAELAPRLLGQLARVVFEKMKLAGEAGSLLRIEDEISEPIAQAKKEWQTQPEIEQLTLFDKAKPGTEQQSLFDVRSVTDAQFWDDAEAKVVGALREYASRAANGRGQSQKMLRRLFADDALRGFAFVDLCRKKFDVVLMNPPFGDASLPSKPYIDETYGDTKGDVYKAFVECFQDRLVPGGLLGIISSRTGFFLGQSADWRERIVLRLYRPLVLADLGMGVLDAMVETAAYVLRSLTAEEARQLTLQLVPELERVATDRKGVFSTKKYEETRGLKRHQANGELRRLHEAGFITPVQGRFPRWSLRRGVMARVQVPPSAAYSTLVCLRLLSDENKEAALRVALNGVNDSHLFIVAPEDFRQVPNTPFCYWVSNRIRKLFTELPPFESEGRTVRQGLATADDFRFVRAWWEVAPVTICPPSSHPVAPSGVYCVIGNYRWFPFAKGGAYSPYYADLHLVVNWERDGEEIRNFIDPMTGDLLSRPQNTDFYFRPGLTWSYRTHRLCLQELPPGAVISVRGSGVYAEKTTLRTWLAIGNSNLLDLLVKVAMGREGHPQFDQGDLKLMPVPDIEKDDGAFLIALAEEGLHCKKVIATTSEVSCCAPVPALLGNQGQTLRSKFFAWVEKFDHLNRRLSGIEAEIDKAVFRLYGVDNDSCSINSVAAGQLAEVDVEDVSDDQEEDNEQPPSDHRSLTTDLISYFVGCAFGRWDARFATGEKPAPELPDPFAPLPLCAPGALQGDDGLPLSATPPGYPLQIDWDGILVDDPDHEDDVIRRVREVFELIWQERAEAIEREACDLLGVRELRDYFRKPGAGGFWTDHVKRYSKSRRKAPIYWLLQSEKKNYAVWIYYHRLDKDILFKALLHYVEPKLRLEENKLTQLRSERASVGAAGREAKQLEKQLDRQEDFLSELRDFHDKLKRAADLNLDPDLNDGVVLSIAPLWEIAPWAEAKKYWQELMAGKYEWSSIGKQLREKGLVK